MRNILLILFSFNLLICCKTAEDEAWQNVLQQNSQEAVDSFLLANPETKYKDEAALKKDEFAWYKARQKNTVYNYKKYAADFPSGIYINEVTSYLDSIPKATIDLIELTTNSFVGKIDYGSRETQIINFKFSEIRQENGSVQFWATINTSDARKMLEGRINLENNSIMFMEDPSSKMMLNLTDGRIYKKQNKIIIESTNISQYWSLTKYKE